jgi:hypothetical protein
MTIDEIHAWEMTNVPHLILVWGLPIVAVLWVASRFVHHILGRRAYARGRRDAMRNMGLDPDTHV